MYTCELGNEAMHVYICIAPMHTQHNCSYFLVLLQLPTIHEVASHEMNFALKVEEFLSSITFPEYRQLIVEVRS